MTLLESIDSPADLKALPAEQVPVLAQEIRDSLVAEVSKTGGHLGPNLGVVELTLALHRVFDSPRDTLVFDTGHQTYVHKLVTGRRDFSGLRQRGGLSGYPSRAESEHDVVENSHATTSLSWAEGIAKARRLKGERDRHTVAVIGDGALTGGMAWEAINNIAADKDLPLVIVVNDNERSYAPTIGGLAEQLAGLRTTRQYEQVLDWGKNRLTRTPVVGRTAFQAAHSMKKAAKDFFAPQGLFEDLGLKYVGPVDGHDIDALEHALRRARSFGGPVLVHVITQKGRGYEPARQHEGDQFHSVGVINPETGLPLEIAGRGWTDEFSDEMVAIGRERRDVVALTAAMMIPVGLKPFAEAFPDRIFDVGIAEQHAVTMASGLAFGGLHPVVAIYATFLNRAFDQLLMDCALHKQGVTFVLDRAGITGSDGASHNGMWDMSLVSIVPGLRLTAPRDGEQVKAALRQAVDVDDAPTVIRFPKGSAPAPIEALRRVGSLEVLHETPASESGTPGSDPGCDTLIVAIGAMAPTALAVAGKLEAEGERVRVIDPLWCIPVSTDVVELARAAGRVAVIEDNLVRGGVGSAVAEALRTAHVTTPVHTFGVPQRFLEHASRGQVLDGIGLTPDGVATALLQDH